MRFMRMDEEKLVLRWWWVLGAMVLACLLVELPVLAQNSAGDLEKLMAQAAEARSAETVYDAVLAGKSCKDNESTQILTCEYKVGTGLHFIIEGLGQPNTGITFLKSSADEDFFGSYGVLHGCVIVSRGERGGAQPDVQDFAFVSPKHGKVYKDWEECREGL